MIIQIGYGGIGSYLLPLLAQNITITNHKYIVVDPDNYSLKNLTNQNILEEDIGKPKVQVASEKYNVIGIKGKYTRHMIKKFAEKLFPNELLLIVSCVDNLLTRIQIAEDLYLAGKHQFPVDQLVWIDTGIYFYPKESLIGGQVIPFCVNSSHASELLHEFLQFLLERLNDPDPVACALIPSIAHATAALLTSYVVKQFMNLKKLNTKSKVCIEYYKFNAYLNKLPMNFTVYPEKLKI